MLDIPPGTMSHSPSVRIYSILASSSMEKRSFLNGSQRGLNCVHCMNILDGCAEELNYQELNYQVGTSFLTCCSTKS